MERLELREAQPDGTPAGLWGLIRWTPLGVQLLREQTYRYFSPEFTDTWTDPQSGREFHDVLVGGGLTNRPFLKELTPVQLSEVSSKPWGSIDKAKLPRASFLIQGDPDHVDSWRLPVYEGAGAIGPDGKYTKRGPLNINGVRAALAALGGAHTGKPMAGVPAGTREKLERWMAQYGSAGSASKKAGEVGMAKRGMKPMADAQDEQQFADGADGDQDDESLAEGDDSEQYAEDAEDAADGGADDAEEGDEQSGPVRGDRHGAMTTDGHQHGKYARHAHDGEADHSDAPLKGKKMSEGRGMAESGQVKALSEQVAKLQKQLHEQRVDKQLGEWGGATFTLSEKAASGQAGKTAKRTGRVGLSKAFRDKYRAFALSEGFAMGEARFAKVNELLSTLLSDGLVDLSMRAVRGYEMEERAAFGETAGDPEAESRRLSERTRELARERFNGKELRELPGDVVARLQLEAAKEIGYRRAQ